MWISAEAERAALERELAVAETKKEVLESVVDEHEEVDEEDDHENNREEEEDEEEDEESEEDDDGGVAGEASKTIVDEGDEEDAPTEVSDAADKNYEEGDGDEDGASGIEAENEEVGHDHEESVPVGDASAHEDEGEEDAGDDEEVSQKTSASTDVLDSVSADEENFKTAETSACEDAEVTVSVEEEDVPDVAVSQEATIVPEPHPADESPSPPADVPASSVSPSGEDRLSTPGASSTDDSASVSPLPAELSNLGSADAEELRNLEIKLDKMQDSYVADALEDWREDNPGCEPKNNQQWDEERLAALEEFNQTVRSTNA